MSNWPSANSKKVLKALHKNGWRIKREARGSHKILERDGWDDYVYAFHKGAEIGPKMLARISKKTGLKQEDFR